MSITFWYLCLYVFNTSIYIYVHIYIIRTNRTNRIRISERKKTENNVRKRLKIIQKPYKKRRKKVYAKLYLLRCGYFTKYPDVTDAGSMSFSSSEWMLISASPTKHSSPIVLQNAVNMRIRLETERSKLATVTGNTAKIWKRAWILGKVKELQTTSVPSDSCGLRLGANRAIVVSRTAIGMIQEWKLFDAKYWRCHCSIKLHILIKSVKVIFPR